MKCSKCEEEFDDSGILAKHLDVCGMQDTLYGHLFSEKLQPSADPPGYEMLRDVLEKAFNQAAKGKGAERHGVKDEPWHKQPIIRHQQAYGIGFALGQAAKKMEEAMALPTHDRAQFELLGAIIYIAAAHYFLQLEKCRSLQTQKDQ